MATEGSCSKNISSRVRSHQSSDTLLRARVMIDGSQHQMSQPKRRAARTACATLPVAVAGVSVRRAHVVKWRLFRRHLLAA